MTRIRARLCLLSCLILDLAINNLGCAGSVSDVPKGGSDSGTTTGGDAEASEGGADNGSTGDSSAVSTGTTSGSTSTGTEGGTAGAFDGGSLFQPDGGPAACPMLAQTTCWQSLVQEYAMLEGCFTHRSLCDSSGMTGDSSQCGLWTDSSRTVCKWPDGTEVDKDPSTTTDVFKSASGAECYRKQFTKINGNDAVVVTFGTRIYTVSSNASNNTWNFLCPDGSQATASNAEFTACNFRGVCCSFPDMSCAENTSP
jgi:hypothetical protein